MRPPVRRLLSRFSPSVDAVQTRRIRELATQVGEMCGDGPTILFGPSFSIYPPSFIHDSVLSLLLRRRGAHIVPIFCDQAQDHACNVYAGDWGGDSFEENCRGCDLRARQLWSAAGLSPLPISRWVRPGDKEEIRRATAALGPEWPDYEVDGLPLGRWADAIVRNMSLVGTLEEAPNADDAGHVHLRNLELLARAYSRAIAEVRPDRIVTNDSYYGMWAILQYLAAREGIPFYSTWQGPRPGTWVYAQGAPAMERELEPAWERFSAGPLTPEAERRVAGWLDRRPTGTEMNLDTATPLARSRRSHSPDHGDDRPAALLAANVVWDLAALDRQVVFDGMVEWVAETIRWFAGRPEYRLVVKAHPGEEHPDIPRTRERLLPALERSGIEIPDNVTLLPPRSAQSVYDLLPSVALGLLHTSTVGVEMAASGLPVIVTGSSPYRGFGFTFDPVSPAEYTDLLGRGLSGELVDTTGERRRLAHHYIDLEYFHYAVETGFLTRTDGGWELTIDDIDALAPGRRPGMDHILTSILRGEDIVAADRWPPAT